MNPCFGWDYPPASYIAVMFAGIDIFFAMRYASLEAMRTRLLDADKKLCWSELFALTTAYLYGIAAVLWLLLWQLGPPNGDWISHLSIFSTCIICRYMCTLGNYVEQAYGNALQRKRVQPKHTVHVVVYGLITCVLPLLYFTDIVIYNAQHRTGVDPPIHWVVIQIGDLIWVACLALSNAMAVPEPPIQITRKILQFDEEFDIDEKQAMLGLRGVQGRMVGGLEMSDTSN